MTEPTRHKDFTKKKNNKPVTFALDGDTFYCAPKLPTPLLRKVSELKKSGNADELSEDRIEQLFGLLREILLDDSVKLYNERLESKTNPIDVSEVSEIISWLMEVYGLRPFQESSDSVDGSSMNAIENAGTSLMDGAPVMELIPIDSPRTDS